MCGNLKPYSYFQQTHNNNKKCSVKLHTSEMSVIFSNFENWTPIHQFQMEIQRYEKQCLHNIYELLGSSHCVRVSAHFSNCHNYLLNKVKNGQ